jgi:hypothetical protein
MKMVGKRPVLVLLKGCANPSTFGPSITMGIFSEVVEEGDTELFDEIITDGLDVWLRQKS